MSDFEFGVYVHKNGKKRYVQFTMGSPEIPNSGYLSNCNASYTKEIVENLKKVINGELNEYEWGQERVFITSYKELSQIEDVTYRLDLGMISSKLLLHLMEEWELFLFKWRDKEKLLEEILTAFRKIIKDHKTMAGPYYKTKATNGSTFILLVLIEKDLNMSEEEFISELDFESALR